MLQRKKRIMLFLVCLLWFVTGCHTGRLSDEKVAEIWVNRTIYGKDTKLFIENFKNGDDVDQQIVQAEKEFQNKFVEQLNQIDELSVTQEEGQKLAKQWLEQTKTKTSYKIKEIKRKEKNSSISVTYEVYGLDFGSVATEAVYKSFNQGINEKDLLKNDQKLSYVIAENFIHGMETVNGKSNPVMVTLNLQVKGTQWYLEKSEAKQLVKFYQAFLFGVSSEADLQKEQVVAVETGMERVRESQRKKEQKELEDMTTVDTTEEKHTESGE